MRSTILCALVLVSCWGFPDAVESADEVDFNRDVRPILSENCFACHGFDSGARQADLRLDRRDDAVAEREPHPAIRPGHAAESELVLRIRATDPDVRMPPAESHKELTPAEIETLERWIAQGAPYDRHWSLVPPKRQPLPTVRDPSWPRSPIDTEVLAKLDRESLQPAPAAEPHQLLRRASLDLLGRPPTLDELDAFLADSGPDAYERAVDRMLASPAFGERRAIDWLDLARYGDTNGYFSDKPRSMWPWRDWVIAAFNDNLPYDEFTRQQMAGDLLPNATIEQKIATGFHRNHIANNETGIIDEEFRVEYVADRLETTASAWLGLTIGCARCHDHKFDPISQKEYYQLFAFFNNVPEKGLITQDNPPPVLEVPSSHQQQELQRLTEHEQQMTAAFAPVEQRLREQIAQWEAAPDRTIPKIPDDSTGLHIDFEQPPAGATGTTLELRPGVRGTAGKFDATQHIERPLDAESFDKPWTLAAWIHVDKSLSCLASKIEPEGERRGIEILWQKGRLHLHLVHRWGVDAIQVATAEPISTQSWHHVAVSYDGSRRAAGVTVSLDGQPAAVSVELDRLTGSLANDEPLRVGRRDSGLGFYGQIDEVRLLTRATSPEERHDWFWGERLQGVLSRPMPRSAADQQIMTSYFLAHYADEETRTGWQRLEAARKGVAAARQAIPTTLVMQELPEPREAHVLVRGQYDQPGEPVRPEVPQVLSAWPPDAPRNRLGFAEWLVSREHPLTARVAVNRWWAECFGEGLARSVNDFGAQGEWPSHPAMLDRLALDFVDGGWDVKGLFREIVTSATYRQSSTVRPELSERDADNRWLARGPSFRLPAELIRDQALAVSGLLVERVGGPSVKPFQPPGLWEAVSYDAEDSYVPDTGAGLWRRSLYTFWKRQVPPPDLLAFDGPTREKCSVHRARTNTPLQALVLLNDMTYLVAAREHAAQILSACSSDEARLRIAFRQLLSRNPEATETAALSKLLAQQRARFAKNVSNADLLVEDFPQGTVPATSNAEWAAWTVVVHSLFNLDEAVTRR